MCMKCSRRLRAAKGGGRVEASSAEAVRHLHGNTGLFRKVDDRGQIPLLCGVHDGKVCPRHGAAMRMYAEKRKRGGKVQERVRWCCRLCESERSPGFRKNRELFLARRWDEVVLRPRLRELMPADLVAEYDAEMKRRLVARKGKRSREKQLQRKYGMTPADLERMMAEQGGACAICGRPLGEDIAVDHDHETGKVRGLLHRLCNSGIGMLGEDPAVLSSAIGYLLLHGSPATRAS